MKQSLRARRMARNHKRLQAPRLNLVALMDIFTILVLFLMVNNGDVEVLQADNSLTLPDSVSAQRPRLASTIKVTREDIRLEDSVIVSLTDAMASDAQQLPLLAQALQERAIVLRQAASAQLPTENEFSGYPVIVMADRDMPYALLKRIMTTCAANDFRDIALAVNSTAPEVRDPESVAPAVAGLEPVL